MGSGCKCLDCTFPGDECVELANGICAKPAWQGDGYCDDGNNNAGCDWDGGDCCDIDSSFEFCEACECLDCEFSGLLTTAAIQCSKLVTNQLGKAMAIVMITII